jgi:hypothetical protein
MVLTASVNRTGERNDGSANGTPISQIIHVPVSVEIIGMSGLSSERTMPVFYLTMGSIIDE